MDPNQPLLPKPPAAPPLQSSASQVVGHQSVEPTAEFVQEMKTQAEQAPVTKPVVPSPAHRVPSLNTPDVPETPERSSFIEMVPAFIGLIIIVSQVLNLVMMHTLTTMIVSLFEIVIAIGIIRHSNVARIIYIFLAIVSLPTLAVAEGWWTTLLSLHSQPLSAAMLYSARALAGPLLSIIAIIMLLLPKVVQLFKQEI